MRTSILAGLVACQLAQPALAEPTVADTYTVYLNEQAADYTSLANLDDAMWTIVSKFHDTSEISFIEREKLKKNATEMLIIIEKMRARGAIVFGKIEKSYEIFCVYSTTTLLPCAEYRTYYKLLITDTIILGAEFQSFTENSLFILTALGD